MSRIVSVLLTLTLCLFTVAACSTETPEEADGGAFKPRTIDSEYIWDIWIQTPRGDVYCLMMTSLTCDWDNPRTTGAR